MRLRLLTTVLLLLAVHGAARAITRFESPATWQIYQRLVTYQYLNRVKPECIDLSPRHSYNQRELAYTLVLGEDRMCTVYGRPGDELAVARLDKASFEVRIGDVIPTLLKPGKIDSDQTFYPGRDGWRHPTLAAFYANGVKLRRVDQTQNRVHRVYYATLPATMNVKTPGGFSNLLDHVCRANGGWNFDLLDDATGALVNVRCHPSGVLWASSLDMVYEGDPTRVEGTDDWDLRTEH